MLNFSYTFNTANRNSQLSSLGEARRLSQKSASNEQNDGNRDSWSFRNSGGHLGSESDNRTASSSSGPESPTSVGKLSFTANTSIISHPIIDLNEIQNQTSKFKRSLSYPPQNVQNRNDYKEAKEATYMPYDYSNMSEQNLYNLKVNNKHLDKLHSYSLQIKGEDDLEPQEPQVLDNKSEIKREKKLNLDEILLKADQSQNSSINRPRYVGPGLQYLPEASEDLLSRLQLKNAGIFDLSSDSDSEGTQDDEIKARKKENHKKGQRKKSFLSRTMSKLNPGF